MIIDNRSAHFDLALPDAGNNLSDDVLRLIEAIEEIDALLFGLAPRSSPDLTGTPTAPTPPAGDSSTRLATTAFVMALLSSPAFTGLPTAPTPPGGDSSTRIATTAFAMGLLASPALTGEPTATTAPPGTNSSRIATTAFVQAAVSALVAAAPGTLDTLNELAAALGNDANFATTVTNALAAKASLTGAETLSNKTLANPLVTGTTTETVYTIADAAAFEINPANGAIQQITLTASRTPKATLFGSGKVVLLRVDDGSGYTLTFSDATFGGSGVVWKTNGGSPPILNTTGWTDILLLKVAGQVYGYRLGNA